MNKIEELRTLIDKLEHASFSSGYRDGLDLGIDSALVKEIKKQILDIIDEWEIEL